MSKWFSFCVGVAVVLAFSQVDARNFRMSMIPNSPAGCNTCHTTGPGSPRNAFGLAVEGLVTPGGREAFWSPTLAALDSDGDGFTNGQELGDPDGDGTADPRAVATRPGSASSFPQSAALAGPSSQAVAVVHVTQNGLPLSGATVSFSRSIAGVSPNYAWSDTTHANGVAIVEIDRTNRSASGYYLMRVTQASGAVIAQKGSVPLNGSYSTAVEIAMGTPVSKVAALGNAPNPFNPATQIRYALSDAGVVNLTVYNTLGQEVTRLIQAHQTAGAYSVTWDAQNVASGLYYYRLEVDGVAEVRKMLLLK